MYIIKPVAHHVSVVTNVILTCAYAPKDFLPLHRDLRGGKEGVRTPAPSSRRTCPSWFRCFNEYYYYYVLLSNYCMILWTTVGTIPT
jgi:hypothetical protein